MDIARKTQIAEKLLADHAPLVKRFMLRVDLGEIRSTSFSAVSRLPGDATLEDKLRASAMDMLGESFPYGADFISIPTDLQEEVFFDAVLQYPVALYNIPDDMRSEALELMAVGVDGMALRLIRPARQTREMCMAAVRQNGTAIDYVAAEHQVEEIHVAAVLQNRLSIMAIPAHYRTEAVLRASKEGM